MIVRKYSCDEIFRVYSRIILYGNCKLYEYSKFRGLTSSSASFSMAVNDSASARLSTAMAKKTLSRISASFLVKERLTRTEKNQLRAADTC